jgi:hypothetical protein
VFIVVFLMALRDKTISASTIIVLVHFFQSYAPRMQIFSIRATLAIGGKEIIGLVLMTCALAGLSLIHAITSCSTIYVIVASESSHTVLRESFRTSG